MPSNLKSLARQLGTCLIKQHQLLTAAESCTGGGLSYWITSIPDSSFWFERGFVTYSNQAKIELLGVRPETIKQFGSVSEETAREMAEGALHHSLATMSVSITGLTGPTRGDSFYPVGTIWVAIARTEQPTLAKHYFFQGSRQKIRIQTMEAVFTALLSLFHNTA